MNIPHYFDFNRLKCLPFIFFWSFSIQSQGKKIFVSTTKDDNNPGMKAKPVQSLANVKELANQFVGKEAKPHIRLPVLSGLE
jgi:hypothetical protein